MKDRDVRFIGIDEGKEYTPCDTRDFSKLDIRDGVIHYFLYSQDGKLIPMTVADTYSNRLLISWIQIHDRYTTGPEWRAGLTEKPKPKQPR